LADTLIKFKREHFVLKKLSYIALLLTLLMAHSVVAHEGVKHDDASAEIKRSAVNITLPKVQMIRQDAKKVQLQNELGDGRIVVLSFIYTTCNAICPMTSHTIAKLQTKLGKDLARVHLVSISIDPEQDTPKRLADYAQHYNAGKAWDHYTGVEDAIIAVQKSMDAYRGDKMNHVPTTFIWRGKGEQWLRIDGFATADDLAHEVHEMLE
jgi:protein SCO1